METDQLKLENQLCFPLYACSREIIKKYKPFMDKIGLTYTQYIVFLVLWESSPRTVKQLGKELYLDSGTLTPLLKKLEADGYITRERAVDDERSLVITLTNKGLVLKQQAMDIPFKIKNCINLSSEESLTLHKLVYKILKHI